MGLRKRTSTRRQSLMNPSKWTQLRHWFLKRIFDTFIRPAMLRFRGQAP
jgi:hypothetical protein